MNIRNLMNNKKTNLINELAILVTFIIIGTIGRTILVSFSLAPFPNFEIIMVITFLAVLIIRPAFAFLVPLFAMIFSDLLIGNPIFSGNHMNKIVIFTYTGFLFISLISTISKKYTASKFTQLKTKNIMFTAGMGVGLVLIYDIWTNFGWWYLYSSISGITLLETYILGIPYMVYHMLSGALTFTLIALPIMFYITNKKNVDLPQAVTFKQYIPMVVITIILIALSFV